MLEAGLKAHILLQAGITNLIGTRFYPVAVPQNVKAFPVAVYRRLPKSNQRLELLTKSSGVVSAFIGITVYAETYEGAKNVVEAFRNELEGFGPGSFDTTTIHTCKQIDESDDFLASTESGLVNDLFVVQMVYQVNYTEAEPTL